MKELNMEIQEGDKCPTKCGGIMYLPPVENCSCHISPPCDRCFNNKLECNNCGHRDGDDFKEETWHDRPSLLS